MKWNEMLMDVSERKRKRDEKKKKKMKLRAHGDSGGEEKVGECNGMGEKNEIPLNLCV